MDFEKKNNIYKTVMTILITAMLTFLITAICYSNYYTNTGSGLSKVLSKQITVDLDDFEDKIKLVKIYLEKYYLGEINNSDMLEGAIKGYVEGLGDPYTEYLTADEYDELMTSINGNFVGIGVYMTQNKEGQICVLAPIDGSPAEKAGIESGDIILYANDEDLTGMEIDLAVSKIKGEEGTTVELEILRGAKTFKVTVERKTVEIPDVESEMLEGNIGYINLLTFDEECTIEFLDHYNKLKEQGMKSLIIDVRDNGGGLVSEVLTLADIILPKDQTIMRCIDKEKEETIYKSKIKPLITDIEIVVLINEYSASASEILAGALQDNKAATIVGTTTYGKGVMQELKPISTGALKITIEEFRTPNGNIINEKGISPDIEVEEDLSEESTEDVQLQKAIEILK